MGDIVKQIKGGKFIESGGFFLHLSCGVPKYYSDCGKCKEKKEKQNATNYFAKQICLFK